MHDRDYAIIWPAPGFPAFLEPHDCRLDLIVASRNPSIEALRGWAQEIELQDPAGKTIVPLLLEKITHAKPKEIAERAGQFAVLPKAVGLCFFRLRLRAPQSLHGERAVRLFGVYIKGVAERPRSVAAFGRSGNALNLAFACDLHVAMLWDEISAAVDRYKPELGKILVNPRHSIDCFIDEANSLAAGGNLDLIVLGGDLVDYVHMQPRASGTNGANTNVGSLLDMLARLEVPTLMIPGNHDYRSYPRRPRSSGLEVVGIPRSQSRSLLKKAGLWDCWPLCARDIDALRTIDADGTSALSDYLTQASPVTDYCCSIRGLRLLLVSSGCDILAKWHEVERARWSLLVRGLRTARYHPDSEGFSEIQLARIRGWLRESRGAALFFHAPLLAARTDVRIQQRLSSLEPGPQNSLADRTRFEKRILRAGFRCGVSFRNPGVLIKELASAIGPISTFSGHLHQAGAVEMDRETMQVRSIDPDKVGARPQTITMLTAPALGQLKLGISQPPGYFLARFLDGALVSLKRRTIDPAR